MKVRFDTEALGLETVLGPLEAKIMDVLWSDDRPYLTNRQIHRAVNNAGHYVYLTTITTTTRRMSNKGLLKETEPHSILVYSPAIRENDLVECIIQRVLGTLIQSWPEELETYLEGITYGIPQSTEAGAGL